MPPDPPQRAHFPLLDPLRLLASVTIVHLHVNERALFGVGFGLPLFLVILFALSATSARRERLADFARRRTRTLLAPWLRWSAVYVALASASDTLRGLPPTTRLEPGMWIYGGHPSLWFLPFAACASVAARLLQRGAERVPPRVGALGLAVLAVCGTHAVAAVLRLPLPDMPLRAWSRFSPALVWGVAVGRASSAARVGERRALLAGVACVAVLGWAVSPQREMPDDLLRRFALAVPLAALGFALRLPVPRLVHALSTLTFGVYLAHPLVEKVLATCWPQLAPPPLAHTLVVWFGAAGVVVLLRRAPVYLNECWAGTPPLRPFPTPVGPAPELERAA